LKGIISDWLENILYQSNWSANSYDSLEDYVRLSKDTKLSDFPRLCSHKKMTKYGKVDDVLDVIKKYGVGSESIGWLISYDVSRNLNPMRDQLMLLLYTSNPIEKGEFRTIHIQSTHFIQKEDKQSRRTIGQTMNLELPFYLPIYGRGYANHLHVIPPEELGFKYKPRFNRKIRPTKEMNTFDKDTKISTDYFSLSHDKQKSEQCSDFLNASHVVSKMDETDNDMIHEQRARFERNVLAMYFGRRKEGEDEDHLPVCPKKHFLKITLTTQGSASIFLLLWHFLLWGALSFLIVYNRFIPVHAEGFLLLFVSAIGQTLATYTHIAQKPAPVRELLSIPLQISSITMAVGVGFYVLTFVIPAITNVFQVFVGLLWG
jgi:hypothetical protein